MGRSRRRRLGIALIVLNAATFPWPPADRGLFDIGPFIGLFVIALAAGWRCSEGGRLARTRSPQADGRGRRSRTMPSFSMRR